MTSGRPKERQRILNMDDSRWDALADIARQIVPESEKPPTANTVRGAWQRNALLRAIADGKATVTWVGEGVE